LGTVPAGKETPVASLLYKLGRWIAHHPLVVLATWVLGLALIILVVARVGADTSNNLSLPGTDSQAATDVLATRLPPRQNGANPVIFQTGTGKLKDGGTKQEAINRAATAIRALPTVESAVNPFSQKGQAQLSKDGKTAFINVLLKVGSGELTEEEAQQVV